MRRPRPKRSHPFTEFFAARPAGHGGSMLSKFQIALGLIAVTACVQTAPAQSNATEVLIQRARALDGQGRHDLAAADWRQVLLLEPAQPEALAALASFYQNTGD